MQIPAIYTMSEYVPADEIITSDLMTEGFYLGLLALSGERAGDYRISIADDYGVIWIHRDRTLEFELGHMMDETVVFHLQTFADVFGVTLVLRNPEAKMFLPTKVMPGEGVEYG